MFYQQEESKVERSIMWTVIGVGCVFLAAILAAIVFVEIVSQADILKPFFNR